MKLKNAIEGGLVIILLGIIMGIMAVVITTKLIPEAIPHYW